ncbi:MAG: hypothetical protein CFE34_16760 [Rhodobacteraceae bacterium PARR1]|nr:MAG: hypothetical protein CFE34_16760 [Rhodobacteraceae bacterium PARR1]
MRSVCCMRDRLPFLALLLFGALPQDSAAQTAPPQAQAVQVENYHLGPREKLFIRIGQWDPVSQAYTAWPDVSGEYWVGADGIVSIPMAGPVQAAGLTVSDLSTAILTQLQTRIGGTGEIDASVEIIEYRPVYVMGEVQTPGAVAYLPGMNVIEAIGLAGGFRRAETAFLQGDRSALASLGAHEVLRLDLMRQLAKMARLQAELDSRPTIPAIEDLANDPAAPALLAREMDIKDARDAEVASQLSQIAGLETLLAAEIDRLGKQITLRGEQLELAQADLANTSDLVERGLTTASRRMDLQSLVADQEVRLLELETARLTAEQRVNEAGARRLDILNSRKRDILDALAVAEGEVAALRARMQTEAALYAEAISSGEGFVTTEGLAAPVIELTRKGASGLTRAEVDRAEALQPGDVVEVRLPLGEAGPGGRAITQSKVSPFAPNSASVSPAAPAAPLPEGHD